MKIQEAIPEGKVIIVGCAGVGKTSLINMFTTKQFSNETQTTIAATYVSMKVPTESGDVSLNLWDTAGQERFKSLIPMYSRNSAAAIIVIDLTNHETLVAAEGWYKMVKDACPPACKVYAVGNKMDLPPAFSNDEFYEWAKSKGIPYFNTSAKQLSTVTPLFEKIAEDMVATPASFATGVYQNSTPAPKALNEKHSECC